jgi:hypothetical protein
MSEYNAALERVASAARIIFDVTSKSYALNRSISCPHGNTPMYPSHAWWCDKCWGELDDALSDLGHIKESQSEEREP